MIVKKGCFNEKCIARLKKRKFKEIDDLFCPKCGAELRFVCASKDCHTHLENDDKAYCDACVKKQDARKQKAADVALVVPKAVGAAAVIAGPKLVDLAIDAGKKVILKK